jgi:hypothetical protein
MGEQQLAELLDIAAPLKPHEGRSMKEASAAMSVIDDGSNQKP